MKRKNILIVITILYVFIFPLSTVFASSDQMYMASLLSGELLSPVSVVFSSPSFTSLAQYGQARLDSLNRLLKHFSVQYSIDYPMAKMILSIDNEPLYTVQEESTVNSIKTVYSFAPDNIYQKSIKPDEDFHFVSFLDNHFFFINRLLDMMYPLFSKCPEAFPEFTKISEDNTSYKSLGKSVRKCIITFKSDYVAEHFPQALQSLAETDEIRRFIGQISFSGVQKMTLYYNQNNQILRINCDGVMGLKPDSMRKVSISWRCLHSEQQKTDYLTLKSPSVKGYDRYNLNYSRDCVLADMEYPAVTWDFQLDLKSGEKKGKIRYKADFVFAEGSVTGNSLFSKKLNGQDESIEIIPDIRRENASEYSGTLEITSKSGKIINSSVSSGIHIIPSENLDRSGLIPATATDLVPDSGEAGDQEIQQQIYRVMIKRIISLPQDDLEFFKQDIPEDIWNSIINSMI